MLKHGADYNDCLPYERSGGRPTEKNFKKSPPLENRGAINP